MHFSGGARTYSSPFVDSNAIEQSAVAYASRLMGGSIFSMLTKRLSMQAGSTPWPSPLFGDQGERNPSAKNIPNSQVDAALAGLAEYQRMRETVDKITQIREFS
jgi:hypothetical protein